MRNWGKYKLTDVETIVDIKVFIGIVGDYYFEFSALIWINSTEFNIDALERERLLLGCSLHFKVGENDILNLRVIAVVVDGAKVIWVDADTP